MILVTGATGFIGRSLTRRLTAGAQEWRAYNGRINDPYALRQQLSGISTVIHLAGAEARGRDRLLHHVDVEGTTRLLEESHRAEIEHLIVVSRLGADPNSLHELLRAKGEVEHQVRRSGVPYTILRSATLFGRGDRFSEIILGMALWSWPFVWLPGGGSVAMQPLWVEDLSRCLAQTVSRPDLIGQTLAVAGEERLRYREIVGRILDAAEARRIPLKIPLTLLRPLTSLIFRWWYWPAVSRYAVDRFFVPEVTDLDTVLHHFGFRPTRFGQDLAYLRRPRLRWRLFRR
jgi:NADH dehydrogenase